MFPTKLGGATWVHVFSPAIVNSARVGFTRVVWNQGVPTDPSGQFGLTGNSKVGITFGAQQYVGFSFQSIGTAATAESGRRHNIGSIIDNTYSYGDNLTWQHGVHLVQHGDQAIRYQNNYITSNNKGFLGSFNYTGNFTSNPNPGAVNGLGYRSRRLRSGPSNAGAGARGGCAGRPTPVAHGRISFRMTGRYFRI